VQRGGRPARLLAAMAAALLVLLALASACSPAYVLRAGWEEAKILARRKPITRLVADSTTPPAKRGKLALVLEARDYAAHALDLDAGDSYTTFSQLDSDTLALVLSAAPKDRLVAHTWWFPIVGSVPYKGFFSERKARREIATLEARGFDTYLRPTSAFSTLGWFNDPMVSALLRYDSVALANTVVHEILHNTFYAAGQAQFNESFANFVGARGAIDFFCRPERAEPAHCQEARDAWHDELLFSRFLGDLVARLEALYARTDLSPEQKIALREPAFEDARRVFAEHVLPEMRTRDFAGFARAPLNNATLLARRLYYGRLDLFERAYEQNARDLPRTIQAVIGAARGAADPYTALDTLLATSSPAR
jgi:predicted aminopeptidase